MTTIYQTIVDNASGNCMQAAVASLLDMPLESVPNFKDYNEDFWLKTVGFISNSGYEFHGTLYNSRFQVINNNYESFPPGDTTDWKFPSKDRFPEIENMEGVDGYFIASVFSPKYFNPIGGPKQIRHAVIINKQFEIVHPVNSEYVGIKQFPLYWLTGYNGILNILMIERKENGKA
ncbi:MAG: hypothetical protein PHT07_15415 [Paludibacter sp.]|nr:hypothetical protein [Paludibacter sp.]